MKIIECAARGGCKYNFCRWTCDSDCKGHTPTQLEVEDDFEGQQFCSITCSCYAGVFSVRIGWDTAAMRQRGFSEKQIEHARKENYNMVKGFV